MSRADIFTKIESATAALKTKAAYPDYDMSLVHSLPKLEGDDLWDIFSRNFKYVNGKTMTSIGQLADFLKENNQLHGYCDPALYDAIGSQLHALAQVGAKGLVYRLRQSGVDGLHFLVKILLIGQQTFIDVLAAAFYLRHQSLQLTNHMGQGLCLLLQSFVALLALVDK